LAEAGVTPVVVNEHVGEHLRVQSLIQIPIFWPNATGVSPDGWTVPNLAVFGSEDVSGIDPPGRRSMGHVMLTFIGVPGIVIYIPFYWLPKSEGHFHISSDNPHTEGRLKNNIYGNPDDLTVMRENVRYFLGSMMTADPTFFPLVIDNATLYDDNGLNAFLAQYTDGNAHLSQLTQMGTSSANSVVDSRFKVWGVQGLRVCDLSAQPIYDGHPSDATPVFGDICGRMILEDAGSAYVAKNEVNQKKAETARKLHEQKRKIDEQSQARKRAAPKRVMPTHAERHAPRATDEQMWAVYETLLETIPTNLPGKRADTIRQSVQAFPYYQQLKAQFGAESAKKKRATEVQNMHPKPSLARR